MFRGALVPCFEVPARADHVLAELRRRPVGTVLPPRAFDDSALGAIHSPRYLHCLATAWDSFPVRDYFREEYTAPVFVFEGGYAVEEVGINAVNVLQAFTSA